MAERDDDARLSVERVPSEVLGRIFAANGARPRSESWELGASIHLDEGDSLIHTTLVVNEVDDGDQAASLLEGALRAASDVGRTELIIPNDLPALEQALRPIARSEGLSVHSLSARLDQFVRGKRICQDLAGDREANISVAAMELPTPAVRQDDAQYVDQSGILDGSGAHVEDVRRYLFEHWSRGSSARVAAVLAPAGHGKSSLARQLARSIALSYLAADLWSLPPIPFAISFADFGRSTSFEALVYMALGRAGGNPQIHIDGFRELIDLGRVQFLLDGLDEMVERDPLTGRDNIREFVESVGSNGRVLLTSRSTFYRSRADIETEFASAGLDDDDIRVLNLQPFTPTQVYRYIDVRLEQAPAAANRAKRFLEDDVAAELMRAPVFLSRIIDEIEGHEFSLPEIRRVGLKRYLALRAFERERERQSEGLTDEEQQRFLETIAFEILRSGEPGVEPGSLEVLLLESLDPTRSDRVNDRLDFEAIMNHHFLDPVGEQALQGFDHQIWREHFQGCAVLAMLADANEHPQLRDVLSRVFLPEGVIGIVADEWQEQFDDLLPALTGKAGRSNQLSIALAVAVGDPDRLANLLGGASLAGFEVRNLRIAGMDLSGWDFAGSVIDGAELVDCDLRGANFDECLIRSTDLHNTKVSPSILEAVIASMRIDHQEFLHNESVRRWFEIHNDEYAASMPVSSALERRSVSELITSRAALFVEMQNESRFIVRHRIASSAFTRGLDKSYMDMIRRSVLREMVRAGLVSVIRTNRAPIIAVADSAEVRREFLDLVCEGKWGARFSDVRARVEGRESL